LKDKARAESKGPKVLQNESRGYSMDIVQNVLLFAQALRARRVGVTIDNVMDALRGVPFVNIQRKEDFYYLLKSNFISRREEISSFHELFEQFWSLENENNFTADMTKTDGADGGEEEKEPPSFEMVREIQVTSEGLTDAEKEKPKEHQEIPQYSPEEALGRKNFSLLEANELDEVKRFVMSFSRKVALRLSRRWKRRKKGEKIDFPRSIRRSVRYGGEIIELKMQRQKQKPLRLIFLCDVSGSMDIYSQFFMLFMYGLQNYYPQCETFVFSTRLKRITPLLKRRPFERALRLLSENVSDWSGGTNIGAAIHQLHHHHSELLSPNRTIFLILSDGWDRGDSVLLDLEMRNLKKHVRKLIWLNPLLESRDYQPVCKGMSTCLPYLDYFLPCNNFVSLKNLGDHVDTLMRHNSGRYSGRDREN
jgi:uncharacterized protein with von Willebrand factor type A (vWA) domain